MRAFCPSIDSYYYYFVCNYYFYTWKKLIKRSLYMMNTLDFNLLFTVKHSSSHTIFVVNGSSSMLA